MHRAGFNYEIFFLSFILPSCLSLFITCFYRCVSLLPVSSFLFMCHLFYRTRLLFCILFFTFFFPFISNSLFITLYYSLFFPSFFCVSFAFLFIPPRTCSFPSYLPSVLVYSLSLPLLLLIPTNLSRTNCE